MTSAALTLAPPVSVQTPTSFPLVSFAQILSNIDEANQRLDLCPNPAP